MARRTNDYYPTPTGLTLALLDYLGDNLHRVSVYEPCAGAGAISKPLCKYGHNMVWLADIDPQWGTEVRDATKEWYGGSVHWVVTNPPFNAANDIMLNGFGQKVEIGYAYLLRLTFLEPTKLRHWLEDMPPSDLLVMPRTSFTGDGKADSATVAWMIWRQPLAEPKPQTIRIYTKQQLKELEQKYGTYQSK